MNYGNGRKLSVGDGMMIELPGHQLSFFEDAAIAEALARHPFVEIMTPPTYDDQKIGRLRKTAKQRSIAFKNTTTKAELIDLLKEVQE